VFGVCPFSKNGFNIDVNNRTSKQELKINVCDGDYNTFEQNGNGEILTIIDFMRITLFPVIANSGYIYETEVTGVSQYPMELMDVLPTAPGGIATLKTDHNGFYWQSRLQFAVSFIYSFIYKCNKASFDFPGRNVIGMSFRNLFLDENNDVIHGQWIDFSTAPCNHIEVRGRVVLTSNNNIGVPNVLVVLTRSQFALTDDNGFYTIRAHDEVGSTGAIVRSDVIVFSGSVCNYTNIDGGCIPTQPVTIVPCAFGNCTERLFLVLTFNVLYRKITSLLSGGTYGIGVVGWDWLGRGQYIQDLGKISIPTIIESQAIGASEVQITIDPAATFPTEIEYLTFWITEELTISDYIDWIVDRFEFIDSTGNINNDAPTQIRIFYESLNEFNLINEFNTTTNWQFLEPLPVGQTTGTQQPFTSDVVQFFLNGDGKFFPKLITGLVKYAQTGQYFLIDYTSDLANLKQNALIRLSRPRNVVNEEEPYFEICDIINIKNQKAQTNQFILNAFDTYYLDRQIPVPAPINPTPTVTQVATTVGSTTTYAVPIPEPEIIDLRVFPFPFEHNSPSNFWGQGCKNIGRVNVKNPYETELIHINQIALGGALSITGQLSYLQYFDDAFKTDFIVQNTGGIVSMFYRHGLVFFITQYSKFLVGYNDNNIRVNSSGQVVVPSASDQFGNPETDLQNQYGCQPKDKSAIIDINGLVHFPDTNRGEYLQSDFKTIKSMTADKCDAWFRAKCKAMQNNPMRYFVACDNPIGNKLVVTDFSLDKKVYDNQERTYNASVNETIIFDIVSRDLELWTSFVGENYASLTGDVLNNNLFGFKNGVSYNFYNLRQNKSFNNFFGIQGEKVIIPIHNSPPFKKKNYLSISIYCKQSKFFSDQITTEAGQLSYLFLENFEQSLYFTYAPFLRDVNTLPDPNNTPEVNNNPLYEGNPLYGNWLQIRLIGDPSKNNEYCEIFGFIIDSINYEKTG